MFYLTSKSNEKSNIVNCNHPEHFFSVMDNHFPMAKTYIIRISGLFYLNLRTRTSLSSIMFRTLVFCHPREVLVRPLGGCLRWLLSRAVYNYLQCQRRISYTNHRYAPKSPVIFITGIMLKAHALARTAGQSGLATLTRKNCFLSLSLSLTFASYPCTSQILKRECYEVSILNWIFFLFLPLAHSLTHSHFLSFLKQKPFVQNTDTWSYTHRLCLMICQRIKIYL